MNLEQLHQVPAAFLGAWQRDYIRRANGSVDTTTDCWWLQSPCLHIDLRVPLDRPALAGAEALTTLASDGAAAFARQTAWTGVTEVRGDRCTWIQDAALPELVDEPDIGIMRFENANVLYETCPQGRYEELWRRAPSSIGATYGYRLQGRQAGHVADTVLTVVATGEHAALALAKPGVPLRVDMAIKDASGQWRVRRSSLPWLEGTIWAGDRELCPTAPWHDNAVWQSGARVDWPIEEIGDWRVMHASASNEIL